MSVTLFIGAFAGAILGFATRNRTTPICRYVFGRHPLIARSIGLILLLGMFLLPTLYLEGIVVLSQTPFFWGGCLASSFIISFFMTSCLMKESLESS